MFPTKMEQLLVVVLDQDVNKVTEELLRQGVLHFINITEMSPVLNEKIRDVSPKVNLARISEIRKRIENILRPLGYFPQVTQKLDLKDRKPVNLDDENEKLDKISRDVQHIRDRQRAIQQEILRIEDIKRQIEMYGTVSIDIGSQSKYSYIDINTGKIPRKDHQLLTDSLKDIPSVELKFLEEEDYTLLMLITMKRDKDTIQEVLKKVNWTDIELPKEKKGVKKDVLKDLDKKLVGLNDEQNRLADKVKIIIESNRDRLDETWANLRINELYYRIQSNFKKTSRTVLFSGWLPAFKHGSLVKSIGKVTKGRCYIEWHKPSEIEKTRKVKVPVQLKNPKFLAPFQMLVQGYAIPQYGTVDPTPFSAFAYLIMFGLMFADVGQGLVIVLIGVLGGIFFSKKESILNLFKLFIWCGLSSIITGILFGSYFGVQWFKPFLFDFHGIVSGHPHEQAMVNDIFDILAIAIYFGISVIFMGLIFNWINLIVKRKWFQLIFNKGGLLGSWIYASGIYVAHFMVVNGYKKLPEINLLFISIGLPAIFMLAKPLIEFFSIRENGVRKKFTILTPINILMEWIVELLEIFTSYLSNTLSFMRVAGFGIAHVCLMIAFFDLARMANGGIAGPPYSIFYIFVIVSGNIMVIGLEGLSAGVQSLRLNYYEFFSKFFLGSGELYTPISLRNRD